MNARVPIGMAGDDGPGFVAGGIVDHQHFPSLPALRRHGVDCLFNRASRIARGGDNRYEGRAGHVRVLPGPKNLLIHNT